MVLRDIAEVSLLKFALITLTSGLLLGAQTFCITPGAIASESMADKIRTMRATAIEYELKGGQEDADAALQLYEQALVLARKEYGETSSLLSNMYFEMGVIALKTSKFQTAEGFLTQSVHLNPTSVTARSKLSELLRLRGKYDEARIQAALALSKHKNSLEARQALAMSYQDLGNFAKANQEFANLNTAAHGRNAPVPQATAVTPPPAAQSKPTAEPAKTPAKAEPETKAPEQPDSGALIVHPILPMLPKPVAKPALEKPAPKPASKAASKPAVALPEKPGKSKPAPKPKAKPPEMPSELKAKPSHTKIKPTPARPGSHGGLVPPPPPVMPVFGGLVPPPPPNMVGAGNPGFQLKTEAKIKKDKPKDKPKEPAKEPAKEVKEDKPAHASGGGGGEDTDFLLDWAADKGKKKGN